MLKCRVLFLFTAYIGNIVVNTQSDQNVVYYFSLSMHEFKHESQRTLSIRVLAKSVTLTTYFNYHGKT